MKHISATWQAQCGDEEGQLPLRLRGKTLLRAKKSHFLGARSSGLVPKTPSVHHFKPRNVQMIQVPQKMCHLLLPSDPRRLFAALRVKSSSLTQRTWPPPTPVQTHLCSHACPECVLPSTSSKEPSLSYFHTQRPLCLVFSDAISPSPVCSCPPVPSAV